MSSQIIELLAEFGSQFVDDSPSSCVQSAGYNPLTMKVTFNLHDGTSFEYPPSPGQWESYKLSPSKGAAFNAIFRGR